MVDEGLTNRQEGIEGAAPPLLRPHLTERGTEGYDFTKAYGTLHDRNQFYRQEMN